MSRLQRRLKKRVVKILELCLEKLHIRGIIITFLTMDFFSSWILMDLASAFHFLYVHPGGQAGFIGNSSLYYVDIYKFRRYQAWEFETPIDWDEGDRIKINETRTILDRKCSRYLTNDPNPGDVGDYLKEVAGRPFSSGWTGNLDLMARLYVAHICMIFFFSPLLLLSLWGQRNRNRLIITYVCLHFVPMFLMAQLAYMANLHVMCGLNVIFGSEVRIAVLLSIYAIFYWIYELVKFFFLFLYWLEKSLARKRAIIGFSKRQRQHRRRRRQNQVDFEDEEVAADDDEQKSEEEESDVDSLDDVSFIDVCWRRMCKWCKRKKDHLDHDHHGNHEAHLHDSKRVSHADLDPPHKKLSTVTPNPKNEEKTKPTRPSAIKL